MRATILLLKAALRDQENTHFILVSDTCAPLYEFDPIYDFLSKRQTSFIRYERALDNLTHAKTGLLSPPGFIPEEHFYKQHQWMILHRDAAEAAVSQDFTENYKELFAPDENYFIQTLWKVGYPIDAKVENRQTTYVDWSVVERRPGLRTGVETMEHHPKTILALSTGELELARRVGCMFIRKVSATCPCDSLLVNRPVTENPSPAVLRAAMQLIAFFHM